MHFSKKNTIVSVIALALIGLLATPLKANPRGFTDQELKGFANAIVQVIALQQQGQARMIAEIEDQEMSVQRFNEIMMQTQELPLEQVEATEEEKKKFEQISEEIIAIQDDLEEHLIKSIEDEGLSLEKYEAIMMEYQQNPELQQRIQELVE